MKSLVVSNPADDFRDLHRPLLVDGRRARAREIKTPLTRLDDFSRGKHDGSVQEP